MPITQDRMLDLVLAAQDYKRALERLMEILEAQSHLVTSNRRTPEQAWQIASLSANAMSLMNDPLKSNSIITAELVHFRNNSKRNERKARKARLKREEQRYGLPASEYPTTAPRHIGQTIHLLTGQLKAKHAELPELAIPVTAPVTAPDVKMLSESTDAQQINSDSDLDFTTESVESTLPANVRAKIDLEIADRLAAEEYEAQYGAKSK